MGSATVVSPAPPKVTLRLVLLMALPLETSIVSMPASLLMRALLPSVTTVCTVLLPARLRSAPSLLTPLPLRVMVSVVVMPPCSASVPPLLTVVAPPVLPRAALLAATSVPALTVVVPV